MKERAKNEPFPLPEDYAGRVFRTCAALEETAMETPKNSASHKKHTKRWMAWAAAAVAAFIAVPNVSPTAAAAMSDVPVLGALVEIVTFREYTYDDGHSSADVSVPELSGGEAADQVNEEVQAYTDRLIAQFQQDCEETGEGYLGLDVSSEVVTNTDSWEYQNIWAIEIPFLAASVLMLVSALVLFFTIRENKLAASLRKEMEIGEEESQAAEKLEGEGPLSPANRKMLLLILAAEVFWFMADNAVGTYFGNYVIYYVHASSSFTMIATIVMGVASVIGFATAGFVADKIGRKYTMLMGLGLALVGYVLMCFTAEGVIPAGEQNAPFPWHLYLVYILKGFGMSLVNTCSFPMVVELATGSKVGKFTGYYYAASMGAQTVTPILLGLVMYLSSTWFVIPIYAAVMMAISIAIFIFVKNVRLGHGDNTPKGLEAIENPLD